MDKKAINEIRKLFSKTNCRVDKMRGCFVDENKNRVFELSETFLALEDEELHKYIDLFKKTLSGKLGRTLFNLDFPLEEEKPGGKQEFLYRLNKSGLTDHDLLDEFYQKATDSFAWPGKYLILLAHGLYDIPARASDNLEMEDASDYVYEFTLCSICPVSTVKEGLCLDQAAQAFVSRSEDLAVQKPVIGFLFPAFNDRGTDLHAALYYAGKVDERYEDFEDAILGSGLPAGEPEQKNVFREIIDETLGRDCDFEAVRSISDAVGQIVEAGKDLPEPVILEKGDVRKMLEDCGADEDAMKKFEAVYDEKTEDGTVLMAENVTDTKKLEVKSEMLRVSVKSEAAEIVERKVIDGREFLLIPVTDDLEVNGIRIRARTEEEEQP